MRWGRCGERESSRFVPALCGEVWVWVSRFGNVFLLVGWGIRGGVGRSESAR